MELRLQQGHSTDAVHDTSRPDDATEAKRLAMQQPGLCIAAARVGCVFAAGLCSCWSCRWQNDNDTLAASCKMASLIVLKNWWLIWNILNLCLEIKRPRHLQNLQDMKDGKVP